MAAVRYPTAVELRPRVPRWVWDVLRATMVGAALSLCGALLVEPQTALYIWWGFFIPLLPAVFFLAPGLWRNVCPLAGFNQAPRRFAITRNRTLPRSLQKYGFL